MMTNILKSRLGFGCYALGGAYGNEAPERQAIELIRQAYDLGICFFDTADQYGTDAVLGKAVRPFRDKVTIATKVGVNSSGAITLNRHHILASCEQSLRRLKTDYLDLYQVHYDDPETPISAVLETLELLQAQGKILAYGVGHLPLARTGEYLNSGHPKTVLAEMSAAALSRYNKLRPLQDSYDFGIIAFSITGRGLLTGRITPDTQFERKDIRRLDSLFQRSKLASGLRIAAKLKELGSQLGLTPAQLAIAWVLHSPGVVAALNGPTKLEHLKENSQAAEFNLDAASHSQIANFIKEEDLSLHRDIGQEIKLILTSPLNPDFDTAASDLMYVLEYTVETTLIPYQSGVDLFMRLMNLKQSPAKSLQDLEKIQRNIVELGATSA